MALFTARMNDPHLCGSHGVGALPDGARNVKVNSQATVRVGDAFKCGGCPNRVQTGASTVTFGGEFAARLTDRSDHGGAILLGSLNVVIGGPTGMGTKGAGKSVCKAMAAGRNTLAPHQSYGNCTLESVRQLVRRATGNEVTEEQMVAHAVAHGLCRSSPDKRQHGAAAQDEAVGLLQGFGVAAELVPASGAPTLEDLKAAIRDRKGVVVGLDSQAYWPDGAGGLHAVVVTSVELDEQGNVIAVFLNDTGLGRCGMRVPGPQFAKSMRDGGDQPLVVTKGPIW